MCSNTIVWLLPLEWGTYGRVSGSHPDRTVLFLRENGPSPLPILATQTEIVSPGDKIGTYVLGTLYPEEEWINVIFRFPSASVQANITDC